MQSPNKDICTRVCVYVTDREGAVCMIINVCVCVCVHWYLYLCEYHLLLGLLI